jgi:hypothetical protein
MLAKSVDIRLIFRYAVKLSKGANSMTKTLELKRFFGKSPCLYRIFEEKY